MQWAVDGAFCSAVGNATRFTTTRRATHFAATVASSTTTAARA